MKKTILTAFAAVACAGAAVADEPVVLNDAAMDNVTAAGTFLYDAAFTGTTDNTITETIDKVFNVTTNFQVSGNGAKGEGYADAFGINTDAQVLTTAQAVEGALSQASSLSIAVVAPLPIPSVD